MTIRNRRRKLPGGICPKCGNIARVIHLRYTGKNGNELTSPIRTFLCECGFRYTYPAADMQTKVVPPNPETPSLH
jgi:hypothetical protein